MFLLQIVLFFVLCAHVKCMTFDIDISLRINFHEEYHIVHNQVYI